MIFLTSEDFDTSLNAMLKKALVTDNPSIVSSEAFAISEVSSYLGGRFNTAQIFSAGGSARHPLIVQYVKDLTIYSAQAIISPQNIPNWCKTNRDTAMQWLKMVANNQLNPDLPLIAGEANRGTFRFGGQTKVTRRI